MGCRIKSVLCQQEHVSAPTQIMWVTENGEAKWATFRLVCRVRTDADYLMFVRVADAA